MWAYRVFDGLWALLPVLLAFLAIRPVSSRELKRFSVRYGVETTLETSPAMKRFIRRGRTMRLAGAALGLSLHPLLYAVGLSIPNDGAFYGVIGYLLGAFAAACLSERAVGEQRRASLVPRRLRDYLPLTALLAPAITVGISALAVLVYELEPRRIIPGFTSSTTGLVLAAVAAAGTLTSIRVVVARPQPITTLGLMAVDDAMRTQAVHTLAGAGTAIALLGTSACLFEMAGYASPAWLHVGGEIGGLTAIVGGLCAWFSIGAAWRVPRTAVK